MIEIVAFFKASTKPICMSCKHTGSKWFRYKRLRANMVGWRPMQANIRPKCIVLPGKLSLRDIFSLKNLHLNHFRTLFILMVSTCAWLWCAVPRLEPIANMHMVSAHTTKHHVVPVGPVSWASVSATRGRLLVTAYLAMTLFQTNPWMEWWRVLCQHVLKR